MESRLYEETVEWQSGLWLTRCSAADSKMIHITHKHPALSYAYRKDLDPETVVAVHYPLDLANKIIPFLQDDTTHARSISPGRSPTRMVTLRLSSASSSTVLSSSETLVASVRRTESPKRARTTSLMEENLTASAMTPARQRVPGSGFSKSRSPSPGKLDTGRTSRTISPGGRQLSPLKVEEYSPLPIRKLHEIPAAHFSPPRATRGGKPGKSPRPRDRQAVRHLIEFEPSPRRVDDHFAQPVLVLRHDLDTKALCDIFAWAKECATAGKIVDLKECLLKFDDISRVRGIYEAATLLGLKLFQAECEKLLSQWESRIDALQTLPITIDASRGQQRADELIAASRMNIALIRSASQSLEQYPPLPQPSIEEDFVIKEETDSDASFAGSKRGRGRGRTRGRGRRPKRGQY